MRVILIPAGEGLTQKKKKKVPQGLGLLLSAWSDAGWVDLRSFVSRLCVGRLRGAGLRLWLHAAGEREGDCPPLSVERELNPKKTRS
jgi:hypothetical protein